MNLATRGEREGRSRRILFRRLWLTLLGGTMLLGTGLLGTGLAGSALASPAPASPAPAQSAAAHVTTSVAPSATPLATTCHHRSSVIHGAKVKAKICRHGRNGRTFSLTGRVRDTAADQRSAVFQIHYRQYVHSHWRTHVKDLKRIDGRGRSVTVTWGPHHPVKDVWVRACTAGFLHRTCDRHWHKF